MLSKSALCFAEDIPVNEDMLKQIARLAIDTAKAVAPLVEATQPHLGPLSTPIPQPTPKQTAAALLLKANALALSLGIDQSIPQE
jgi:hypothetical protein